MSRQQQDEPGRELFFTLCDLASLIENQGSAEVLDYMENSFSETYRQLKRGFEIRGGKSPVCSLLQTQVNSNGG
jgi:hypothetical protein